MRYKILQEWLTHVRLFVVHSFISAPNVRRLFSQIHLGTKNAMQCQKLTPKLTTGTPIVHHVTAYSTIYGVHPSKLVFGKAGKKMVVGGDSDAFTGVPREKSDSDDNKLSSKELCQIVGASGAISCLTGRLGKLLHPRY